jgi:uncharacterized membrane protein YheB (UPF0754 family)
MNENFYKPDMEANPLNFSSYLKNIDLKEITDYEIEKDYRVYIDEKTNDMYINKYSFDYSTKSDISEQKEIFNFFYYHERFIALITKGILHTSDLLEKDGKLFSKVIDLNKIESTSKEEFLADLFILRNIFSDYVHTFLDKNKAIQSAKKAGIYAEGTELHHNIARHGDKFIHFDYGESLLKKLNSNEIEEFKNKILNELQRQTTKEREVSKNKIELIREELTNKKFFDAVVLESKIYQPNKSSNWMFKNRYESPEEMRFDLLNRVDIILRSIENLESQ